MLFPDPLPFGQAGFVGDEGEDWLDQRGSARRRWVRSARRQGLHGEADSGEATRRNITDKVAGSVIDDADGRELYLGYAREDRSALWLRLPYETQVSKALRVLADVNYLHTRDYGSGTREDSRV
jgi:hypothetical protein